jgi:hypothetical protein
MARDEVAAAKPELLAIPAFQRIIAHHTTPREAGVVFTRAHPNLAHIVSDTRQTYQGPLVIPSTSAMTASPIIVAVPSKIAQGSWLRSRAGTGIKSQISNRLAPSNSKSASRSSFGS